MDAFASSACASSAGLARVAGLSFSDDARPGVTRRRVGKGFAYYDARGALIRDKATIARIKAITIPPAWEDVWIAPSPRGHIQATGRDARGRKQYRYHEDWTTHRETTKFALLPEFAAACRSCAKQSRRICGCARSRASACSPSSSRCCSRR